MGHGGALPLALTIDGRTNGFARPFFGWVSDRTNTFGTRSATTNYSLLYVAQGLGSVLGGPVAAALRHAAGSWTPVFLLAAAMDVLAALLALFELKAMRQAWAAADAPSEEVRGPAA